MINDKCQDKKVDKTAKMIYNTFITKIDKNGKIKGIFTI